MRLKQRNPPEQNRSIDGCSLTAVNKKTPWDSKRNPAEFFYFCHFSCSRCLFVCISLPHYEIDKVNRIQQQHDQPVFSCEHLLFRTEEVQQHGGGNTDDAVDNKFLTECDRSQKAGSAENKKDIEDIIERYHQIYYIGSNGPDFLFFQICYDNNCFIVRMSCKQCKFSLIHFT